MSEKTLLGKRDLNIEGSHWQNLNMHDFKISKPTIICLGGNRTITEKDANAVCKIAQHLLLGTVEKSRQEELMNAVDFIGVSYKNKPNCDGNIGDDEITEIVDKLILPLCLNDGNVLTVDAICKNLSRITFFSHCHGARETFKICKELNKRLIRDFGLTGEDTDRVFESMAQISYASNTIPSFTPNLEVFSGNDEHDETVLSRECDFKNGHIVVEKDGTNEKIEKYFESVVVLTDKITDEYNEHGLLVLDVDENGKTVSGNKNGQVISNIVADALKNSVKNSFENMKSNNYVPKLTTDEMFNNAKSIANKNEKSNSL